MVELDFLTDGGQMGARIRAFDWSATSIGVPATWPQSLRTLTGVLLTANQPMYVAWGPDCVMIYNDAYIALLGQKHPAALGHPFETVWSEAWSDLEPLVDQVFAGEPVHMDDITLRVDRNGTTEEAHFAYVRGPQPAERRQPGPQQGRHLLARPRQGSARARRAQVARRSELTPGRPATHGIAH